jgi:DNA-binding FrmR family transcriptional regulator
MKEHPSHAAQVSKLNRAIGQLEAIRRMIEDRQYCVDIMTQLRAARSALKSVELGVLETHMNACLSEACHAEEAHRDKRVAEIMALLKKYD